MINLQNPAEVKAYIAGQADALAYHLQKELPGYAVKLTPVVLQCDEQLLGDYVNKLSAAISKVLGFESEEWKNETRIESFVMARQIFAVLIRDNFPNLSLKSIGVLIGNKKHCTILYSYNKAKGYISVNDKVFMPYYNAVCNMLNNDFKMLNHAAAKV